MEYMLSSKFKTMVCLMLNVSRDFNRKLKEIVSELN